MASGKPGCAGDEDALQHGRSGQRGRPFAPALNGEKLPMPARVNEIRNVWLSDCPITKLGRFRWAVLECHPAALGAVVRLDALLDDRRPHGVVGEAVCATEVIVGSVGSGRDGQRAVDEVGIVEAGQPLDEKRLTPRSGRAPGRPVVAAADRQAADFAMRRVNLGVKVSAEPRGRVQAQVHLHGRKVTRLAAGVTGLVGRIDLCGERIGVVGLTDREGGNLLRLTDRAGFPLRVQTVVHAVVVAEGADRRRIDAGHDALKSSSDDVFAMLRNGSTVCLNFSA